MNVDEMIHDDIEDLRELEEELRDVIGKIVNDRRAIRDSRRPMAGVSQQHVEFLQRRLAHNERRADNIGQWIIEAIRRIDDFHEADTDQEGEGSKSSERRERQQQQSRRDIDAILSILKVMEEKELRREGKRLMGVPTKIKNLRGLLKNAVKRHNDRFIFKIKLKDIMEGPQRDTAEEKKQGGKGVIDFLRQVFMGRDQLQKPSQKILDRNGSSNIKQVWVMRKPIQKLLTDFLGILTAGKFQKSMMQNAHDDLFHLSVILLLENGKTFNIEKNETVKISRRSGGFAKDEQHQDVPFQGELTMLKAFDRTIASYEGPRKAYAYDSQNNNCQKFVNKFLTKNPEIKQTPDNLKFVNQDLDFLFEKFPAFGPLAKILTQIRHHLGIIQTGGDENKIVSKGINKMQGEGILKDIKDVVIQDIKAKTQKQARMLIKNRLVKKLKAKGEKLSKTALASKVRDMVKKWVQHKKGQKGGACSPVSDGKASSLGVTDRRSFRKWSVKGGHPDKYKESSGLSRTQHSTQYQQVLCWLEIKEGKQTSSGEAKPKPAPKKPSKPAGPKPTFEFEDEEDLADDLQSEEDARNARNAINAGGIAIIVSGAVWGAKKLWDFFKKGGKRKRDKKRKQKGKGSGLRTWLRQKGGCGDCQCGKGPCLSKPKVAPGFSDIMASEGRKQQRMDDFRRRQMGPLADPPARREQVIRQGGLPLGAFSTQQGKGKMRNLTLAYMPRDKFNLN